MKKYRVFSVFLLGVLLTSLLSLPAAAAGSGSAILDHMHVEAAAALLVDDDYGEILYEQNAHERRYPASITKVMTALLTLEAVDRGELSLDQVVTVTEHLYQGIGSGGSTVDIKAGEQLTVLDLLYCVLLPSANEACNALAEAVSGSIDDFIVAMNVRADELGMEDTHYTNTHGYHDDNHYTTAWDIYLMCHEANQHETFRTITSSRSYELPATNMHEARTIYDTNALISSWQYGSSYLYEYATGIKTGSTPEAGYCLASSATKGNKHLIAVVLGAENPKREDGSTNRLQFSESSRLLQWGFENFSRKSLIDTKVPLTEIPVTLAQDVNTVAVHPVGTLEACLPNDLDPAQFDLDWTLNVKSLEAPVTTDQVVGTVTVSYNGKEYGTLNLVPYTSVERSDLLYRLDQLQKFFDQLWVKILLLAVIVLIAVLILRHVLTGRRRGRRRAYSGVGGRNRYTRGRRRRRY